MALNVEFQAVRDGIEGHFNSLSPVLPSLLVSQCGVIF